MTAAIVLWNTVYLERAANALRGHGQAVDDGLLQYLSPLGREHINLTGDYLWRSSAKIGTGKAPEEKAHLSEIIQVLNERFGTTFTDEDRLFFDQIKARAASNSQVIQTAMANPLDKFQLGVRK